MGWKGTLRTVRSTVNKMERESKRRERELEKRRKEYQKLQEREQALFEVEEYENYIERIQSIHKEDVLEVDWESIFNEKEPIEPIQDEVKIIIAEQKLQNFKPTFFQKLFRTVEKNLDKLKRNFEEEKLISKKEYEENIENYKNQLLEITERKEIAKKVLDDDSSVYLKIIDEFNPFEELSDLGSSINFYIQDKKLFADLNVHSDEIIPNEIKSILKSGKLSTKNMPKGVYNELYQDYVCSTVLRVAKEVYAILPIEEVVINAKDELLNTSTGYKDFQTVLSVYMVRETFENLNLEFIDPSDSMSNFKHNMNFKKTIGFKAVENII